MYGSDFETDSRHQCKMLVSCYFASFMIQTFSVRFNVPGPRSQVLCPSTISQDLDFRFQDPGHVTTIQTIFTLAMVSE